MERKYIDQIHPAVGFFYIAAVLVITMITMNPYLLAISCITSIIVMGYLKGLSELRKNIVPDISVIIFTVGIQPVFSGSGKTVLYYVNDRAVYLEGYIYGLVIAMLLITVFNWCTVMRILMDSEKWMYLIGRLSPTLAMMITMILRFIPLMRQRYRVIHEGQVGMGRYNNLYSKKKNVLYAFMGFIEKIRHRIKEISILISWSLENSIETSDSMESRGYGLKGRTSYHRYILKKTDMIQMILIAGAFAYVLVPVLLRQFRAYYLPRVYIESVSVWHVIVMVVYIVLAVFPVVFYKKSDIERV